MTAAVLDASALLAMLLGEPGAEVVKAELDGADMAAVNVAEVVSHYAKLGATRREVDGLLRALPVRIVLADAELSVDAGMLRPLTLEGGLSLGDRYCLALARRKRAVAFTAEKRWPQIAAAAGVEVRVIR